MNLTAPAGVRAELRRGLAWVEEGHAGDGLRPATVAWARRLAGGAEITRDKAVKMRVWLARHKVDSAGEGFSRARRATRLPGASLGRCGAAIRLSGGPSGWFLTSRAT